MFFVLVLTLTWHVWTSLKSINGCHFEVTVKQFTPYGAWKVRNLNQPLDSWATVMKSPFCGRPYLRKKTVTTQHKNALPTKQVHCTWPVCPPHRREPPGNCPSRHQARLLEKGEKTNPQISAICLSLDQETSSAPGGRCRYACNKRNSEVQVKLSLVDLGPYFWLIYLNMGNKMVLERTHCKNTLLAPILHVTSITTLSDSFFQQFQPTVSKYLLTRNKEKHISERLLVKWYIIHGYCVQI